MLSVGSFTLSGIALAALVGTTGDYSPLSYREANGNYWGFKQRFGLSPTDYRAAKGL